jgi:hypothetical protein
MMSSVLDLFTKYMAKVGQLSMGAALIGAAFCQQGHAQNIGFGSPAQLGDNVANNGSPTIVWFRNQPTMYYVNHSNGLIYVDIGLTGNPQSTGLAAYTAGGALCDVGAAVLNGNDLLITYVGTSGTPMAALTANGVNITSTANINSTTGFNKIFAPTPVAVGSAVEIALVGTGNLVYLYETFNGTTFGVINSGNPVSSDYTDSRPSLTMFNGQPYIAFTAESLRQALIGPAANPTSASPGVEWGNNNSSGGYAGIALIAYNNVLYAYGQNTASSQNLIYIYSTSGGGSWSGAEGTGIQMRWTPSLMVSPSNIAYLVYQDDNNTNISHAQN